MLIGQRWIAVALLVAGAAYQYELRRQKDSSMLQMPLKRVGLEAMSLAIGYALLVVAGLW